MGNNYKYNHRSSLWRCRAAICFPLVSSTIPWRGYDSSFRSRVSGVCSSLDHFVPVRHLSPCGCCWVATRWPTFKALLAWSDEDRSWGPLCAGCVILHVFLFGCPLGTPVLAQDATMVAVVLRQASSSWCGLGSTLLNDEAMMPPQPANHFDLRGGSSGQGSCLVRHSLVMVDPLLCRGARYACRCGALGCLQSLGILSFDNTPHLLVSLLVVVFLPNS